MCGCFRRSGDCHSTSGILFAVNKDNRLGLVLAGGAARGAYEAGVLRFIYSSLATRLGFSPWPSIVGGTSVGALNGVFVVTQQLEYIQRISRMWQEVTIGDVYLFEGGGVFSTVRSLLRAAQEGALLNPAPLRRLVRREFPRAAMRRSIDSGDCQAFIISATRLDNGLNTLFCDSAMQDLTIDPPKGTMVRRGDIDEQHFLASTSLPFFFPPHKIGPHYYVDGGLRQNTPLRPVIRSGADRILIIGAGADEEFTGGGQAEDITPSLPFLAGKTLNALLLDPVSRDLHHTEQINRVLAWGREQYGEEYSQRIAAALGVREVATLFLRPKTDLGRIASEIFVSNPPKTTPQVRWLMSLVADQANAEGGESDFLSYLFFDHEYTGVLERMGYEDARDQEEVLAQFFLSDSHPDEARIT
ncbi:MAG: NTE family protein [Myxococcota bacterium]|jgi:NTE family protein